MSKNSNEDSNMRAGSRVHRLEKGDSILRAANGYWLLAGFLAIHIECSFMVYKW